MGGGGGGGEGRKRRYRCDRDLQRLAKVTECCFGAHFFLVASIDVETPSAKLLSLNLKKFTLVSRMKPQKQEGALPSYVHKFDSPFCSVNLGFAPFLRPIADFAVRFTHRRLRYFLLILLALHSKSLSQIRSSFIWSY